MLMSAHLKNYKVQYLNNQASDDPGFCLFAHLFTFFQAKLQLCSPCMKCGVEFQKDIIYTERGKDCMGTEFNFKH